MPASRLIAGTKILSGHPHGPLLQFLIFQDKAFHWS
jgi:hypothetical protein